MKKISLIFVIFYITIFIIDVFMSVEGSQHGPVKVFLEKSSLIMGFVFWVAMLIDYMQRIAAEGIFENRMIWGLVIFFGYVLGAFIYFVVIYYPSDNRTGSRDYL